MPTSPIQTISIDPSTHMHAPHHALNCNRHHRHRRCPSLCYWLRHGELLLGHALGHAPGSIRSGRTLKAGWHRRRAASVYWEVQHEHVSPCDLVTRACGACGPAYTLPSLGHIADDLMRWPNISFTLLDETH